MFPAGTLVDGRDAWGEERTTQKREDVIPLENEHRFWFSRGVDLKSMPYIYLCVWCIEMCHACMFACIL